MQMTSTLFAAVMAATTVSAAPVADSKVQARDPDWLFQGMKRTCDDQDTSCTWEFTINNQIDAPVGCTLVVNASGGSPASQSPGGPVNCGDFTTTSGWDPKGFTVVTTYSHSHDLITYPSWDDNEIKGDNLPDKPATPEAPWHPEA